MEELRFEYLYEEQPYRLNGNRFAYDHVMSIKRSVQKRYKSFAERIIAEGGYIELDLSDSSFLENGIHYEALIKGISKGLQDDIEREIPSPWNTL